MIRLYYVIIMLLMALLPVQQSAADEFQPLAVRISLSAGNDQSGLIYRVETKIPNDRRLQEIPRAELSADCQRLSDNLGQLANKGYKRLEVYRCSSRLHGSTINIRYQNPNPGLSSLLAIDHGDGNSASTALAAHQSSWLIPEQLNTGQIGFQYFKLGVQHLLSGFDHLLFISCLLFICLGEVRRLIWTITAFTLAHSVSLGLTAYGKISINVIAVEAIIALSIAYLASDIARHVIQQRNDAAATLSLSYRYPASIAALFGLLHGLGFANILNEFGLPQSDTLIALLSFNLGIEVGQLLFVTGVFIVTWVLGRFISGFKASLSHGVAAIACSYAVGSVALFWTVQRVAGAF